MWTGEQGKGLSELQKQFDVDALILADVFFLHDPQALLRHNRCPQEFEIYSTVWVNWGRGEGVVQLWWLRSLHID